MLDFLLYPLLLSFPAHRCLFSIAFCSCRFLTIGIRSSPQRRKHSEPPDFGVSRLSGCWAAGPEVRGGLPGGGAACPCGARCAPPPWLEHIGSTVLSPPRAILSQGGRKRRILVTLPCPGGARCAASVSVRRCLPCGQRRCRAARRILACRGRKQGFGTFFPSRGLSRRAGGQGNGFLPARGGVFPARRHPYALPMSLSPQETEIRAIPQSERTLPLPQNLPHLSIRGKRGRYKPRLIAPRISRRTSGARPSPASRAFSRPSRHRLIPQTIPPGERRALPAPAQGSKPLRIPFWGAAAVSPQPPSPKTPQAAGPCSWACRRLLPPPPHSERNEARPPPARGAGVRRIRANGTVSRHCRPAGGRPLLVGRPPCMRSVAGAETNEAPMPPARGAWAREHSAEGTGSRYYRAATAAFSAARPET